jgi:hypothetical protein
VIDRFRIGRVLPAVMFAPLIFGVSLLVTGVVWVVPVAILRAIGAIRSEHWAYYAWPASDVVGALIVIVALLRRLGVRGLRGALLAVATWIWALLPWAVLATLLLTYHGET